jgi:hypothetical protein
VICKGKGYGAAMLADALKKSLNLSQSIGAVALIVDAKDQKAKEFYEKHQFIPLRDEPFKLYLPMGTIAELFS